MRTILLVAAWAYSASVLATAPPVRYCPDEKADLAALADAKDRAGALASLLETGAGDTRRIQCLAEALLQRDRKADDAILVALLQGDPRANVRATAAAMLGNFHAPTPTQLRDLAAGLRRERDPATVKATVATLRTWALLAGRLDWTGPVTPEDVIAIVNQWPGEGRAIVLRQLAQSIERALEEPQQARNPKQEPLRRAGANASLWIDMLGGTANQLHGIDAFALLEAAAATGRLALAGPATSRAVMDALVAHLASAKGEHRAMALRAVASALLPHDAPGGQHGEGVANLIDPATLQLLGAQLGQALEDGDPLVRAEAARALGGIVTTHAMHIERLVLLLSDNEELVRGRAARALSHLPSLPPRAVPPLQRMAVSAREEARGAVAALARSDAPQAAATLVRLLRQPMITEVLHPDWGRQEIQVDMSADLHRAIRQIGSPALPALLEHLASTRNDAERDALVDTVEAIGWAGAGRGQGVLEALMPALQSESAGTRHAALALLATWSISAQAPFPDALVERIVQEHFAIPANAKTVRPRSTGVLFFVAGEKRGIDPQVAAALVASNSTSPAVARQMIRWMCSGRRLESNRVINASITGEPIPDGHLDTIRDSLALMGPAAVQPVLDTLVRGANKQCREELMSALSRMDLGGADAAAVRSLMAALSSKRAGLRAAAVAKLSQMPDLAPAAAAAIGRRAGAANARDPKLAETRDRILERFDQAPRASIPDWLEVIEDAAVLGREGGFAVPALVAALQSGPDMVRVRAAYALGCIGAQGALPALVAAAAAPSARLSRAARLAMRRIELAR